MHFINRPRWEFEGKEKLSIMSTNDQKASELEIFEKMDIAELEQYIQKNPYNQYYKNKDAWRIYAYRLLNGTGCPKDSGKALDYFEKIANEDTLAALQAGQCYYYGIGTSQDLKEALKYFKCTSDNLGPISRTGYLWQGKCLLKMQKGQEAIECLKQVMKGVKLPKEIRYAKPEIINEAKCLLGLCYYYGIGVEENKETAFKYLKEAALEKGANLTAQYYLAQCYQNGIGTKQNPERAEHWRSMCFEQDYKKSASEMEELLGIL